MVPRSLPPHCGVQDEGRFVIVVHVGARMRYATLQLLSQRRFQLEISAQLSQALLPNGQL